MNLGYRYFEVLSLSFFLYCTLRIFRGRVARVVRVINKKRVMLIQVSIQEAKV